MNKDKIIEAMARALTIYGGDDPDVAQGGYSNPNSPQWMIDKKAAESAFNAFLDQLPVPMDGNPDFASALYERSSVYERLISMKE